MIRPGAWLGLLPGVPDPLYDLGLWRDLLTLVAAAVAWLLAKGRTGSAFAASVVFAVLAIGFWVLALGRAYGVFVDPEITRWAAHVSVAARAGGAEGFLVGEPGIGAPWTLLAASGVPAELLILSGTLAPLVLIPAIALVIVVLGSPRPAWLATILWLAASTGSLAALRGLGLVDGAWRRPVASAALILMTVLVLLAARALPARAAFVTGVGIVLLACRPGIDATVLGTADALLLLTLDQWPWLVPAGVGLMRGDRAARALAAGGAVAVLAAPWSGGGAWLGHGAYRIGLLLFAATGLVVLADKVALAIGAPEGRVRLATPPRLLALVVFAAMAGGFLVWWDPWRMDPIARASAEPVAPALDEAMAWVRANTDPQGTFVASADFVPAVAVLGGRRVLRAPGLAAAPDDERRLRAERAILTGRAVPDLVRRYGLRYVFAAPGDFVAHGLADPIDLLGRGGLRLLYVNARGMRVYELPPGPSEAVK